MWLALVIQLLRQSLILPRSRRRSRWHRKKSPQDTTVNSDAMNYPIRERSGEFLENVWIVDIWILKSALFPNEQLNTIGIYILMYYSYIKQDCIHMCTRRKLGNLKGHLTCQNLFFFQLISGTFANTACKIKRNKRLLQTRKCQVQGRKNNPEGGTERRVGGKEGETDGWQVSTAAVETEVGPRGDTWSAKRS